MSDEIGTSITPIGVIIETHRKAIKQARLEALRECATALIVRRTPSALIYEDGKAAYNTIQSLIDTAEKETP